MSSRAGRKTAKSQTRVSNTSASTSREEQPVEEAVVEESTSSEAAELPGYSAVSISHLFMQLFFSNPFITEDRMNCLMEEYNKNYKERATKKIELQTLINRANRNLRPIGFQIKRTFDPMSHQFYYVLDNEIEDKLGLQNTWSKKESTFYYAVLDEIVQTFLSGARNETVTDPDSVSYKFMSISKKPAINLAHKKEVKAVNVGVAFAEKLLDNWIYNEWFAYVGSNITLGIRSLAVMSKYLNRKYSLFLCYTCNFTCLLGIICPKCKLCIHYHCLEGETANGHPCPTCNVPMSSVKYLLPMQGEQDDETSESD